MHKQASEWASARASSLAGECIHTRTRAHSRTSLSQGALLADHAHFYPPQNTHTHTHTHTRAHTRALALALFVFSRCSTRWPRSPSCSSSCPSSGSSSSTRACALTCALHFHKVFYSLTTLPFLFFKLPVLGQLLTHARATGKAKPARRAYASRAWHGLALACSSRSKRAAALSCAQQCVEVLV